MQISLEWLADFCEVTSVEEALQGLVSAGIDVEHVFDPQQALAGVVVAEVVSVAPHPQADRLQVCAVQDGHRTLQVVCGAPNVLAGARVAWAPPGARVPAALMQVRALRGVDSHGMLCSRADLGLAGSSDGLWILPSEAAMGTAVAESMRLSPVFTLSITPNRPDLLAHLGVARELAAANNRRLRPHKWRLTEKGPDVGSLARVVVDEPALCRRYVGRVLRGVKVGPSPAWLRERLERIGQRSINTVVDATNYVMHELGQPLHAFDLTRLAVEGGLPTLHVRLAQAGERLTTLDGVQRSLTPDDLVVADAMRPVALAGLMGGAEPQVTEQTTHILLEGAVFDAGRVRQMARRHGLHTDAGYRFERGADAGMVARAVERCAQILTEVAEGEAAKGALEVAQKPDGSREIALRMARVQQLLGCPLAPEQAVQLLEPLEIRCTARTDVALVFQPPTARPDLQREVDLIEELARRIGYDAIPSRLPDASGPYTYVAPSLQPMAAARSALLAAGCSESIAYGFGNPLQQAGAPGRAPDAHAPLLLQNPLGQTQAALRVSLLPGLLTALAHNLNHGVRHVRLFELGRTFHPRVAGAGEGARAQGLPEEVDRLAVVLAGGRAGDSWYDNASPLDFTDLAGILDSLREACAHGPLTRVACERPGFAPSCTAHLHQGNAELGVAGLLSPELLRGYGIDVPVYAAEVSLSAWLGCAADALRYRPLPRYPASRRDVAVLLDTHVPAAQVRTHLKRHAGGALGPDVVADVWLFDVYRGKPVPPGKVSLGLAISYRHPLRTLTEAEVQAAFAAAIESLSATFGAEVRAA